MLYTVKTDNELCERLREINKPKHTYIIPLNVNGIDGSFTATNHWVGLHICTDENAIIIAIKYLNPIGRVCQKVCVSVNKQIT